jgi:predicted alpha/beta hydrolase
VQRIVPTVKGETMSIAATLDASSEFSSDQRVVAAEDPRTSTAREPELVPFAAWDGFQLTGHWTLPAEPTRVTVIHPATAVPQRYYLAFASWLAARGHAVLVYDYRGIGLSRTGSLRGFRASMDEWVYSDAPAAMQLARKRFPDLPLSVIGHSMGGHAMMMNGTLAQASSAAFVGSGSGYWGYTHGLLRLQRLTVWNVLFPGFLNTLGYVPGWAGIGEDLPHGVASQWCDRCLNPTYFEPRIAEEIRHNLRDLPLKVRSYAFTDDDYINPDAVNDFAQYFPEGRFELRTLSPAEAGRRSIGHFRAFRPDDTNQLWTDIAGWLEA